MPNVSTGVAIVMPAPGHIPTKQQHSWHYINDASSDDENTDTNNRRQSDVVDLEANHVQTDIKSTSSSTETDMLLRQAAIANGVDYPPGSSSTTSLSRHQQVVESHQVGLIDLLCRKVQLLLYRATTKLEPFFRDVTTKVILRRLIYAVLPHSLKTDELLTSPDLYGPLMLVLSQVQVLRVGMRYHNIHINEQALIATCLVLCFTYWALLTFALVVLGRIACGTSKNYPKSNCFALSTAACVAGYALFGHVLVLLANHLSPFLFYPTLLLTGSGASVCLWVAMVRALPTTTTSGWVSPVAGLVGFLHFAWLWHLRSTYAT